MLKTNFHPLNTPKFDRKWPKWLKFGRLRPAIWKPCLKFHFLRSKKLPEASKSLKNDPRKISLDRDLNLGPWRQKQTRYP